MIEETARAKVNLALHVVGRRPDGFHMLDSVVVFADVFDRLTITPADRTTLNISGPLAAGINASDNLVLRAQEAMYRAFGRLVPNVAVKLEKFIPAAAGLGGGSADAAATLRALCRLASLDPFSRAVQQIALSLGSDVPVCLYSSACRFQGIGELIEPLADFPAMHVVLANARQPVSTSDVFSALGLAPGEVGYPPIEFPFDIAASRNDLTPPATQLVPVISEVLAALKSSPGVTFARMSGSGGTCFALFDSNAAAGEAAAEIAKEHSDWWIRPAVLR